MSNIEFLRSSFGIGHSVFDIKKSVLVPSPREGCGWHEREGKEGLIHPV